MNFRWIFLTMLVIVIFGGLVSSAYANAITRDLTVSRTNGQSTIQSPATSSVLVPKRPTSTTKPGQLAVTTLARDTFQRANQALWGTAVDGQNWDGDANSAVMFSIAGGMGQIAGGQGTFNAILGPTTSATDVSVSATTSRFDAGKVNIGAVVRWKDANNWYKALIDGTQLSIIKHIHGIGESLTSIPFRAQAGIVYTLRIRAQGTTLSAKVWPTTTVEPTNWMIVTSDMSLTSGRGGIRVVTQSNAIIRISAFLETTVNDATQ